MNKNTQKNITGKIEIEINGVKYVGGIDFAADTGKNAAPAAHITRAPVEAETRPTPDAPIYEDGTPAAAEQPEAETPLTINHDGATPLVYGGQYPVYGVKINRNNSDPAAAVTYTDAAAGFTPATAKSAGSWAGSWPFNAIKPCLFKDGAVVSYLNPDNYNETVDGIPAAITSGEAGDVMVEFPKIYYRITQDEQFTYVQITEAAASILDGFSAWAYSYKGTVRDRFYIGAYKGVLIDGRLRSLSGRIITTNKSIGEYRKAAQANGEGYEITPFNKLTLLQALYLIRFKSLDSQTALGAGYTNGTGPKDTGETNAQGFYFGRKSQTSRVKCHGIEDLWGNVCEWIDGLITAKNAIYIADGGFGDYDEYCRAAKLGNSVYGYTTKIHGTNDLGFLIAEAESGGGDKTYYSDYGATWNPSGGVCVPIAGGFWYDEGYAGAFFLYVYSSPALASDGFGARLCFCA